MFMWAAAGGIRLIAAAPFLGDSDHLCEDVLLALAGSFEDAKTMVGSV